MNRAMLVQLDKPVECANYTPVGSASDETAAPETEKENKNVVRSEN